MQAYDIGVEIHQAECHRWIPVGQDERERASSLSIMMYRYVAITFTL